MKSVDEGQGVCLQTDATTDNTDRAPGSRGQAGRFGVESRGELADRSVVEPVAAFHMQAEQVGVDSLTHGDVVAHEAYSHLPAEQANDMKESGKGQGVLRFGKSAGKDGLQDDRGDQANKGKRLA